MNSLPPLTICPGQICLRQALSLFSSVSLSGDCRHNLGYRWRRQYRSQTLQSDPSERRDKMLRDIVKTKHLPKNKIRIIFYNFILILIFSGQTRDS